MASITLHLVVARDVGYADLLINISKNEDWCPATKVDEGLNDKFLNNALLLCKVFSY